MFLKFHTTEVTFEQEDDDLVTFVWFAAAERRHYLFLSRFKALTGSNDLEIERDDQKWLSHGGVTACRVSSTAVDLAFSEEASAALGGLHKARIEFSLDPGLLSQLTKTMSLLFRGNDGFSIA